MLSFSCSIEGCKGNPTSFCSCVPGFKFLCNSHIEKHFEDRSVEHSIRPMYRKIDPLTRNQEIKKYNDLIFYIKKSDENSAKLVSSYVQSISKAQQSYSKYFRENSESVKKVLENLQRTDKELIVPGIETEMFNDKALMKHFDEILNNITLACEKSIKKFETVMRVFKGFKEYYKTPNYDPDENLHFFKPGTKTLIKFDLKTLETSEHPVDVESNQGSLAGICQTDERTLFVYGSYSPYLDTAYLIDLKTYKATICPKGRNRAAASATFCEGFVYVFGGITGAGILDYADKFDVEKRTWVNLPNLPCPLTSTNVLNLKKYFVISSNTPSIYKYNIVENTYEVLYTGMPASCNSILIRDAGVLYLLSNSSIYESSDKSPHVWKQIDKMMDCNIMETTSKAIYKDRCAYFYTNYGSKIVYKFDFERLDLEVFAVVC